MNQKAKSHKPKETPFGTYPTYLHKFNVELSHYTKGETIAHMFYDSKYLLPGLRLTAAVSYLDSAMSPFYGFNGYASPLDMDLTKDSSWYYMSCRLLSSLACFSSRHSLLCLRWLPCTCFSPLHTPLAAGTELAFSCFLGLCCPHLSETEVCGRCQRFAPT